jgi:hypothetical protein
LFDVKRRAKVKAILKCGLVSSFNPRKGDGAAHRQQVGTGREVLRLPGNRLSRDLAVGAVVKVAPKMTDVFAAPRW